MVGITPVYPIGHIISSLLEMSSREDQALVICASQFATALHSDGDIPHYLQANEFLTKETYDEVISPKSTLFEYDKACVLVSGIRRRVEQSPTDFHKLVGYLKEKGDRYRTIVKLLEETYSALELPSEASCDSQASPPQPEHVKKIKVCTILCYLASEVSAS